MSILTLNHDVRVNPRKGHRLRKSEKVNQNKLAQKESKEILATAYRYDLPKRSVDSPDFMSAAIRMQQQVVDLVDCSSKWHLIREEASIVASMLAEEGIPYTSSSLIVSGLTIDVDLVSDSGVNNQLIITQLISFWHCTQLINTILIINSII